MAGTILDYAPAPTPGARIKGQICPLTAPAPTGSTDPGEGGRDRLHYRPRAHGQHRGSANLPTLRCVTAPAPTGSTTSRQDRQICRSYRPAHTDATDQGANLPLDPSSAPAHTGVRDQAANWLLDPSSDRRQTHRTAPSALLVGGPLSVPAYVVRTSPRGASVPLSTSRPWILSATQARPSWRLPGNPWGTRGARAPFRDLSF